MILKILKHQLKILNLMEIGFNRLSVIDVSNNGHQPMSNKEKSIYIMFNGEIIMRFN